MRNLWRETNQKILQNRKRPTHTEDKLVFASGRGMGDH